MQSFHSGLLPPIAAHAGPTSHGILDKEPPQNCKRHVGIDLGKTTFHLVALGAAGKILVRKKFTQLQLLTYTANMQTSLIGLEACSGLTSWAVPYASKVMMFG